MKRILLSATLLLGLSACAPLQKTIQTAIAPYAVVLVRDGADLVVPNPGGPFLDDWQLSIDVSTDYQTDAQGQAWCLDARTQDAAGKPVVRPELVSPKYGRFNRIHCSMPGLTASAQRRIVTASGRVLAAQGFAYRAASGALPVPLTLP